MVNFVFTTLFIENYVMKSHRSVNLMDINGTWNNVSGIECVFDKPWTIYYIR